MGAPRSVVTMVAVVAGVFCPWGWFLGFFRLRDEIRSSSLDTTPGRLGVNPRAFVRNGFRHPDHTPLSKPIEKKFSYAVLVRSLQKAKVRPFTPKKNVSVLLHHAHPSLLSRPQAL